MLKDKDSNKKGCEPLLEELKTSQKMAKAGDKPEEANLDCFRHKAVIVQNGKL